MQIVGRETETRHLDLQPVFRERARQLDHVIVETRVQRVVEQVGEHSRQHFGRSRKAEPL